MKLLLDEHISRAVASGVARRKPDFVIKTVSDVGLRSAADGKILTECKRLGYTLVTFDLATIPKLLREWAAAGESHAGAILVDERAISSGDYGTIIEALLLVIAESDDVSWNNRVTYLRNPKKRY